MDELKKIKKASKKLDVEISKLWYEINKLNGVITQLVLVTSILQSRTGGIITDDELKKEDERLHTIIDKGKKASGRS